MPHASEFPINSNGLFAPIHSSAFCDLAFLLRTSIVVSSPPPCTSAYANRYLWMAQDSAVSLSGRLRLASLIIRRPGLSVHWFAVVVDALHTAADTMQLRVGVQGFISACCCLPVDFPPPWFLLPLGGQHSVLGP